MKTENGFESKAQALLRVQPGLALCYLSVDCTWQGSEKVELEGECPGLVLQRWSCEYSTVELSLVWAGLPKYVKVVRVPWSTLKAKVEAMGGTISRTVTTDY